MGLFLWGKGKTDHSDSSQAGEQKRRNDSLRRITFLLRIFEELLKTTTVPTRRKTAGEFLPAAGIARARGHRCARLPEPPCPWLPTAADPGRFAARVLAGCAQGYPGGSSAPRAPC